MMATKRVLVIDDDEPILMVLQSCFEDVAQWQVVTANSGYDGLLKAATEQPDVIILDVMMPGMDGFECLKKLKTNPHTQSIPVVLLTAKVDLIQNHFFVNSGVVGAIAKPFDPFLLIQKVAAFLNWEIA